MLSWCAGVALVPHGEARAEGPAEGPAEAVVAAPKEMGPRAPAVEVTTAKRVRHDVYFGMGFGFGGGNAGASRGAGLGGTGWMRLGGRLREKVGLGGALTTSFGGGGDGGGTAIFTNVLVEALFFPIKRRGLGLSVGAGFSAARPDGLLGSGSGRRGAGLSLGVGYDFWLARRFNFGLWLRADASAGGYGLASAGTFGLALSWY
jgi:hypothetical protein